MFPNLTLYTQNISFHYQALVAGQTYNVAIRATNNGAQRLNGTASSDGVEVSLSPQGPSKAHLSLAQDDCAKRQSCTSCDPR